MNSTSTALFVTHSQIAVFKANLQNPFNDWTQEHVDQGFAWREGSVSFATLIDAGPHRIDIVVTVAPETASQQALRVIAVPFSVAGDATLELATVSESTALKIPAARYELRCELFARDPSGVWPVRLVFVRTDTPDFKIIRNDGALVIHRQLLKSAQPAG